MTAQRASRGLICRLEDYDAMIRHADAWGPRSDPERRWFLAGWRDLVDGENLLSTLPPDPTLAAKVAYGSGWVAAGTFLQRAS